MTSLRTLVFACLIALLAPATADAQWVVKPFAGLSVSSSYGFVDLEQAAGKTKPIIGVAFGWQPTDLGVEVEFATAPNFFKTGGGLLNTGKLDTLMANVTWFPLTGWRGERLRPYVSGGAGVVRVSLEDALGAFSSDSTLAAGNVGGGLMVQLRRRLRVNGEVRYVRSRFGDQNHAGFGEEFVAFTRVTLGAVLRF